MFNENFQSIIIISCEKIDKAEYQVGNEVPKLNVFQKIKCVRLGNVQYI